MTKVVVHLRSGGTYLGDDERDIAPDSYGASGADGDTLLEAVVDGNQDDLPPGWIWIAGLYVKASEVIGLAIEEPNRGGFLPANRQEG